MQDSFINKVAAKYNIAQRSTTYPAVPLVDGNIGQSTEEPDDKRTKLYQELVGSLAYISTYTRPDVAQTHSELSRYLQNPGQKHISAAYHTWKYLIGQKRYVSRYKFVQLVEKYCIDPDGPFQLFCDDFRPQNILVDPATLRIKAVLGLKKFTNAMPSQYASEAPWWLLPMGPDSYLLRHRNIGEFIEAYEPRLEHFLKAMEKVEKTKESSNDGKPLSCLIRESWATERFWFNYATRKPFDVKALSEFCAGEDSASLEQLDEETHAGLETFIEMKTEPLKVYDDKCAKVLYFAYHAICLESSINGHIRYRLRYTETLLNQAVVHVSIITACVKIRSVMHCSRNDLWYVHQRSCNIHRTCSLPL
jgi:hypothetical protein